MVVSILCYDNDSSSPELISVHEENKEAKAIAVSEKKQHRSVTFSPQLHIRQIPTRDEPSSEERRHIYLNKSDYKRIRQDMVVIVKALMDGSLSFHPDDAGNDEVSLRGMEALLPGGATDRRIRRKKCAVEAVLKSQLGGIRNDKTIAEIYAIQTASSARKAYKRGLRDQHEIPFLVPRMQVMFR
jgi:hypothetical protein